MEQWKSNPTIYEINTWVWLGELSIHEGYHVTLANVPDEYWNSLMLLHIDAVWFMGVWERSPAGIAISNQNQANLNDFRTALPTFAPTDNVGSPYCIRNYKVDQHLGGQEGLSIARAQLARRNIKLVLDYVPNHLAHDHHWVSESPEYFIQGSADDLQNNPANYVKIGTRIFACGKDPFYPSWQDVIQVNIFHPDFREAIIETMVQTAKMCDGFRCDMAMLVMNEIFEKTWKNHTGPKPEMEFWEEMISSVRMKTTDFIFIAESYWDTEWSLQQMGFDYCYDKRLYDRLENADAYSIRSHLNAGLEYQSHLIRFTENHDELRQASVFYGDKNRAASIVASTIPGAKLFHEGAFEGRRIKVPVFLCRRPFENTDYGLLEFFHRLLNQLDSNLFHEGFWNLNNITGWPDNNSCSNMISWQWGLGSNLTLIVVNYSSQPAQGMVHLSNNALRDTDWLLQDDINNQIFTRNGNDLIEHGLFVSLSPWKFHFELFPAMKPLSTLALAAGGEINLL